jgi:hypothetical protein
VCSGAGVTPPRHRGAKNALHVPLFSDSAHPVLDKFNRKMNRAWSNLSFKSSSDFLLDRSFSFVHGEVKFYNTKHGQGWYLKIVV